MAFQNPFLRLQVVRNDKLGVDSKDIALWKALCTTRDTLLNELQNLSREIDQRIDDLDEIEQMIIQLVKMKLDGLRT